MRSGTKRTGIRLRRTTPSAVLSSSRSSWEKRPLRDDLPEFKVAAIYRDDKFTYIKANPQETPALYEIKDGKPSLVQFRYINGMYTVDKVLVRLST